MQGFASVEADQTDDAELKAICFAIKSLKGKLSAFTIFCDNESVVSQIHAEIVRPRSRPVLKEILAEKKANPDIQIEFFGKNPAHSYLNQELTKRQENRDNSVPVSSKRIPE